MLKITYKKFHKTVMKLVQTKKKNNQMSLYHNISIVFVMVTNSGKKCYKFVRLSLKWSQLR